MLRKKISIMLLISVVFAFTFSNITVNASFSGETRGVIYDKVFTVSKPFYETYDIMIYFYDEAISKNAGDVTIRGVVSHDEIWEVDQFGNKLQLKSIENSRFQTGTIETDYRLKAYVTVDDDLSITSTRIVLSGWATWSGLPTQSDDFRFIINASQF